MDGVAVDGVDIAFLVVLEDDITPERTGADDVLETVSISGRNDPRAHLLCWS